MVGRVPNRVSISEDDAEISVVIGVGGVRRARPLQATAPDVARIVVLIRSEHIGVGDTRTEIPPDATLPSPRCRVAEDEIHVDATVEDRGVRHFRLAWQR